MERFKEYAYWPLMNYSKRFPSLIQFTAPPVDTNKKYKRDAAFDSISFDSKSDKRKSSLFGWCRAVRLRIRHILLHFLSMQLHTHDNPETCHVNDE